MGIKEIAGWSNDRFSCIVLFGRQLDKKRPTWTTTIPFSDNQYLRKRVLIHKHRQSKQSQISEPSGTPSTPPSPTSNSFRFEDIASPWVVSDEVLNLPIKKLFTQKKTCGMKKTSRKDIVERFHDAIFKVVS